MSEDENDSELAARVTPSRLSALDIIGGIFFLAATIGFILLMVFHSGFRELAWARHHNIFSWYIRPLMLIPFCFFARRKSLMGMSLSIFALATSMMWFPEPLEGSEMAAKFLAMEVEYLSSNWTPLKFLSMVMIPAFFVLLGLAFWRRKPIYGVLIMIGGTVIKMIWSVLNGGDSGYTLFPAAIIGILICGVVVVFGARKDWF